MSITLDPGACLFWALLILTVPLPWLISAAIAGLIHEISHLFAMLLAGAPFYGIRIGLRGAKIITGPLEPGAELLCAAAGPLGSLLLLFFLRRLPRIALCGTVQGLFNLLPLYPMDGGRILRSTITVLRSRCKCEKFLAKKGNSLYNSATKVK